MNFDLDQLLLRDTFFKPPNCFSPGEELVSAFHKYCKVLVVGAGGLGCEILKNLALSGVPEIEIIDLDSIELTNLNRYKATKLTKKAVPFPSNGHRQEQIRSSSQSDQREVSLLQSKGAREENPRISSQFLPKLPHNNRRIGQRRGSFLAQLSSPRLDPIRPIRSSQSGLYTCFN